MPQMAPSMWLILMIFFFCVFILFNILNYFMKLYTPVNVSGNMKNHPSMNWKW